MEHIHLQLLQDFEGYKKGDVIAISSVKLALRYVQDKIATPYVLNWFPKGSGKQ